MTPTLTDHFPPLPEGYGQEGVSLQATAGPNGPFTPFFVGDTTMLTPIVLVVLVTFTAVYGVTLRSSRHLAASAPPEEDTHASIDPAPTVEFLQPTERVVHHLRQRDGRAYQQELVEEIDKSAASVSRYLSELEDANRIRRVRIDRKNLVILGAESIPDGTRSDD